MSDTSRFVFAIVVGVIVVAVTLTLGEAVRQDIWFFIPEPGYHSTMISFFCGGDRPSSTTTVQAWGDCGYA